MTPLILALLSSLLFLGLSLAIYGAGALVDNPWVTLVLLGLIGSGLLVFLTSRPMPAWLCRLTHRSGLSRWLGRTCAG
jgi:hypothetical protein